LPTPARSLKKQESFRKKKNGRDGETGKHKLNEKMK